MYFTILMNFFWNSKFKFHYSKIISWGFFKSLITHADMNFILTKLSIDYTSTMKMRSPYIRQVQMGKDFKKWKNYKTCFPPTVIWLPCMVFLFLCSTKQNAFKTIAISTEWYMMHWMGKMPIVQNKENNPPINKCTVS